MGLDRRDALAVLASFGSAGLVGSGVGPAGARPASSPRDTQTATAPAPSVTLRSSFRYYYNTDAIGIDTPEKDQFAFVEVPPGAAGTPLEAFSLELGDRAFQPRLMDDVYPATPGVEELVVYTGPDTPGGGETDTRPGRTGALIFDVPTVEVEEGWLVSDETRYALPDESLPSFARAPSFTLEAVSVPDTVQRGDPVEITVEVTNEGGRRGVFLAGAGQGSRSTTVNIWADPGETAVGTMALSLSGGSIPHFVFNAPGYSDALSVRMVEQTPTPTRGAPDQRDSPTRDETDQDGTSQNGTPSGDLTSAPPSQPTPGFSAVTGVIALFCAGGLRWLQGRHPDD